MSDEEIKAAGLTLHVNNGRASISPKDGIYTIQVEQTAEDVVLVLKQTKENTTVIWDQITIETVHDGMSPYRLTLSNDYDAIAVNSAGEVKSTLPIMVEASLYNGSDLVTNGTITCIPENQIIIKGVGSVAEDALPNIEGKLGDICRSSEQYYYQHDGTAWVRTATKRSFDF
jgi:hypothetical protein